MSVLLHLLDENAKLEKEVLPHLIIDMIVSINLISLNTCTLQTFYIAK